MTTDVKRLKKNHIQSVFACFVFLFGGLNPLVCGPNGSHFQAVTSRTQSTLSHTQILRSTEQKRSAPINKACLIQPQRSSLPSCLCLRKDTTAVTQTGVYPRLRAAGRAIIHRLGCQRRLEEGTSKVGTKVGKRKRKRWK